MRSRTHKPGDEGGRLKQTASAPRWPAQTETHTKLSRAHTLSGVGSWRGSRLFGASAVTVGSLPTRFNCYPAAPAVWPSVKPGGCVGPPGQSKCPRDGRTRKRICPNSDSHALDPNPNTNFSPRGMANPDLFLTSIWPLNSGLHPSIS